MVGCRVIFSSIGCKNKTRNYFWNWNKLKIGCGFLANEGEKKND